ncbi:hypothetical protein JGU66_31890 [Myxococcaceae bacterium JPH2]|nr:hypothetical protein [Myxococcaceae bacterium JPH2]
MFDVAEGGVPAPPFFRNDRGRAADGGKSSMTESGRGALRGSANEGAWGSVLLGED